VFAILVTALGIFILVNPVQLPNISERLVIELFRVTLVRYMEPKNVALVTEFGIVYDVLVGESKYITIEVIAALNNIPSTLANAVFAGSTLINPLYW